jgi:hypothetical protein
LGVGKYSSGTLPQQGPGRIVSPKTPTNAVV